MYLSHTFVTQVGLATPMKNPDTNVVILGATVPTPAGTELNPGSRG